MDWDAVTKQLRAREREHHGGYPEDVRDEPGRAFGPSVRRRKLVSNVPAVWYCNSDLIESARETWLVDGAATDRRARCSCQDR
jgi:hypothetical protein